MRTPLAALILVVGLALGLATVAPPQVRAQGALLITTEITLAPGTCTTVEPQLDFFGNPIPDTFTN